eukprot:TRINITY_DN8934_c0_g1_i3.p1 TRINITY_DN8934_c0_g1~~TRINITY_DN8934_c0_g1_i3.p1  ORF type:complete len:323 (+),score=58.45 TRINITY_DN8934_c0_g1_i3:1034-2002(+)
MKDLYQELGLQKTCSSEDIRRAYRTMALKFHPDKNKTPEAAVRFQTISQAYQILSDPTKRRLYDDHGITGPVRGDDQAYHEFMSTIPILLTEMLTFPLWVVSVRSKAYDRYNLSTLGTFFKLIREEGVMSLLRGSFAAFIFNRIEHLLAEKISVWRGKKLRFSSIPVYPFEVITTCIATGTVAGIVDGCMNLYFRGWLSLFAGVVPYIAEKFLHRFSVLFLESFQLEVIDRYIHRLSNAGQRSSAYLLSRSVLFFKLFLIGLITCPLRTLAVRAQIGQGIKPSIATSILGSGLGLVGTQLYAGLMADVIRSLFVHMSRMGMA